MTFTGVAPGEDFSAATRWRDGFLSLASGAIHGATAGSLGGLLVGGVGGRLAMFGLRLTSPHSVRGIETDDGFEIGIVTLSGTVNLLFITMALGSIAGLFIALSLRFLPWRVMPLLWALPGATLGGAGLIHSDGIDFNLLGPLWLAVSLFIAIPAVGTATIALLIRASDGWWWTDRLRTAAFAVAAWPIFLLFPIAVAIAIAAAFWGVAVQSEALRQWPSTRSAQRTALVAFSAVTLTFAVPLAADLRDVL
jgi:hypothetical protein